MKSLPLKMRKPRNCRTITGEGSWYYIEPKRIVVVAHSNHNQLTTQAALTRRQLEAALAVMGEFRGDRSE